VLADALFAGPVLADAGAASAVEAVATAAAAVIAVAIAFLRSAGAVFEFRGKSGKQHRTAFHDRRLARVLRRCEELPGQRLFQYVDEAGERRHVESQDVNAYIREAMGEDFSAKDFRTWAATLSAARALCRESAAEDHVPTKKTVTTCVKAVAGLLDQPGLLLIGQGPRDQRPVGVQRAHRHGVARVDGQHGRMITREHVPGGPGCGLKPVRGHVRSIPGTGGLEPRSVLAPIAWEIWRSRHAPSGAPARM